MACAALRLARFNTESDSASFTGLASPSAAAGDPVYDWPVAMWLNPHFAGKRNGRNYRIGWFVDDLNFSYYSQKPLICGSVFRL